MAKNDGQLNDWNNTWRSSPYYTEIMMSIGVDPTKPMKLSDEQRKIVQSRLEQMAGQPFENGLEIDPAGNMNQNEGFGKQLKKWGPLAGGVALTLFGIPGVMPGLLSGGASAAAPTAASAATGGGGGTLASYGPSAAMQAANMGYGAGIAGAGAGGSAAGGATMGITGGTTGAGSMGIWNTIGNLLKGNASDIIGTVGSVLSKGAQDKANNRGTELEVTMDANKLNQTAYRDWYNQMLDREQEGRTGRNDSWKALQQGEYVAGWKPSTTSFSPYTRAITPPSDAVREAGAARAADARTRLTGYTMPTPERQSYNLDPKLMKPGVWENILGYGGLAGTAIGSRMPMSSPPLVDHSTSRPQVMPRNEPTLEDAFRYGFNF
jgi:hypothetical protein